MARSRITGEQIVDADVLSEAEHDAWIHRNLVCSGTITFEDTEVMVSGSGDIYCKDLHTENNSIYIGETKISTTVEGGLLVDDAPVQAEATVSGFSGSIPVITDITVSGSNNIATKIYLVFENGLLTTYSGGGIIEIAGGTADNLLSIL